MKNKIFNKPEKIFVAAILMLLNFFCFIKFIITLINYSQITQLTESYGSGIEFLYNFNLYKILSIITLCFTFLIFVCSVILIFIKNQSIKSKMLISIIVFSWLMVIFFFVLRFSAGHFLEYNDILKGIDQTDAWLIKYAFVVNMVYLIVSLVLSISTSLILYNITNQTSAEETTEEKIKETEQTDNNIEESYLETEINKLKAKLRIKDLEKEYLSLKSKLDE